MRRTGAIDAYGGYFDIEGVCIEFYKEENNPLCSSVTYYTSKSRRNVYIHTCLYIPMTTRIS